VTTRRDLAGDPPVSTPSGVSAVPEPAVAPAPRAGVVSASALGRRAGPTGNTVRVVYGSTLFVSVTLLFFSYLGQSVLGTSVFGAASLLFLVLLALPPGPGR
jgi:hypothetical protein